MSGIVWLSTDDARGIGGRLSLTSDQSTVDSPIALTDACRQPMSLVRGLLSCAVGGVVLTLLLAWPVVMQPSTRIFGTEIVGRQHDPFTVMWQFEHKPPVSPYRQPLVDDVGWWLAREIGPVAAFNLIVLASFPLAAAATYALARYLALSHVGALIAALAFAFAPPHLAHAAYHPHIAQTHWTPLFVLALWACLDRGTMIRAALLVLSIVALSLSNLYAAFFAVIVAPIAVATYWIASPTRRLRPLLVTAGTLAVTGSVGATAVCLWAPAVFAESARAVAAPIDILRHGAWWWAYFVPPVDHAVTGPIAARLWERTAIGSGLLEQQLSISWALLVLAACAVWQWARDRVSRVRTATPGSVNGAVPVLVCVAAWALWCSLAPGGDGPSAVPAAWLHPLLPMFRAYARLGIVVHLMIALLAGIAVTQWLAQRQPLPAATYPRERLRRAARQLWPVLVMCVAFEYAPLPWRSRDVLPTQAHRWLAEQPGRMRVLDCVRPDVANALIPWLMHRDVAFLSTAVPACDELEIAPTLAALGYTHVIARGDTREARRGLTSVRPFADAHVFEVRATPAPIIVVDAPGFHEREGHGAERWQWLGQRGTWVLRNTTGAPLDVRLDVALEAFVQPRQLTIALDGQASATVDVDPVRRLFSLGPWRVPAGEHRVQFAARELATRASGVLRNGDARDLTIRFTAVHWRTGDPSNHVLRGSS